MIVSPELRSTAAEGWSWWTGELASANPAGLRPGQRPVPKCDIWLTGETIIVERIKNGAGERLSESCRIEALEDDGWGELAALCEGLRTRLILSAPDAFVTTLSLPAASRGRIRTAAGLQLGQAAPVDPALLSWNTGRARGDQQCLAVPVAMARTNRIAFLQGLFAERGLSMPEVAASVGDELIVLAAGEDGADTLQRLERKARLGAALLVLTIPFTALLGAHLLTAANETRIAGLQQSLAPRFEAERRWMRAEELRRAVKPVFEHPSATETIETLALALPESAFALGAERQLDGSLSLVARTSDRESLDAGLRDAPLLARLKAAQLSEVGEAEVELSYRSGRR